MKCDYSKGVLEIMSVSVVPLSAEIWKLLTSITATQVKTNFQRYRDMFPESAP